MKDPVSDLAFLNGGNMTFLESLYQESVGTDSEWSEVFASLPESRAGEQQETTSGSQAWFESSIHKQAGIQINYGLSVFGAFVGGC